MFVHIVTGAPDIFVNTPDALNTLVEIALTKIQNDKCEIAIINSDIISAIAKCILQNDQDSNFLSNRYESILNMFIEFGFCTTNQPANDDYSKNSANAFATFIDLLEKIPNDNLNLLSKYLGVFFNFIERTLDSNDELSRRKDELQQYFFLVV